jgi:hypothetical protein
MIENIRIIIILPIRISKIDLDKYQIALGMNPVRI